MIKVPRISNGEKTVSSLNGVRKTGQSHRKIKLTPYFITYTKINSKDKHKS